MPGLDPGIHPASQEVLSKTMDCRVTSPPDEASAQGVTGYAAFSGETVQRNVVAYGGQSRSA